MRSSEQPVRLTDDGGYKFSPQFTAGGREVVYTLFDGATLMRLMRLRLAGGAAEPLHKGVSCSGVGAGGVGGRALPRPACSCAGCCRWGCGSAT